MIKRIYLEITNRCNLNCSFCTKHTRTFNDLSISEIESIINQAKEITPYLYLHVQGEPLLHPSFDEILDLCDKHLMQVNLTTNATLLGKYPLLLKHSSIRKIALSLHAYDELDRNIDDVMNNINNLINTKQKHQYIELRFWNKEGLKDTSKSIITRLHTMFDFKETSKPHSYLLANNLYLHYDSQFDWPSTANNKSLTGTCKGVKNMLCILSNGDVTPCCLDQDANINLGNIFNENLANIIKKPRYHTMMQGLANNQLIEELCQKCTYRNRFD